MGSMLGPGPMWVARTVLGLGSAPALAGLAASMPAAGPMLADRTVRRPESASASGALARRAAAPSFQGESAAFGQALELVRQARPHAGLPATRLRPAALIRAR